MVTVKLCACMNQVLIIRQTQRHKTLLLLQKLIHSAYLLGSIFLLVKSKTLIYQHYKKQLSPQARNKQSHKVITEHETLHTCNQASINLSSQQSNVLEVGRGAAESTLRESSAASGCYAKARRQPSSRHRAVKRQQRLNTTKLRWTPTHNSSNETLKRRRLTKH